MFELPFHKDERYIRYLAVLSSVLCPIVPHGRGRGDWYALSFYKDEVCHDSMFPAGLKRATWDENVWTTLPQR